MSKVTKLQEWMIANEKDMPNKVFHIIMGQLQSIAKEEDTFEASWLSDDLVDTVNRYKIPQYLTGERISILQDFDIKYTPDELPQLTLKYLIMNDEYKPCKPPKDDDDKL